MRVYRIAQRAATLGLSGVAFLLTSCGQSEEPTADHDAHAVEQLNAAEPTPPVVAGGLEISDPIIRKPFGGSKTTGAYVRIRNVSDAPDRLIAASTPVANNVELHDMEMSGGVMRMRPVEAIEIPAGAEIALEPGGMHLMVFGVTEDLATDDEVPVTLTFERAGAVEISVIVGRPQQSGD